MIGEHDIAGGFSSFWAEVLPLLTPSCVTVFNRTRGDYLRGCRPVDRELGISNADLRWPDLLAEVAFDIFKTSVERQVAFADVLATPELYEAAWRVGEASISLHRNLQPQDPPPQNELSHRYLLSLGRRYDALRALHSFEHAEFFPRVRGCGVLGACEADLSLGTTLVEVKTVDRNFNSKDIKQVIVYLSLDYLSGVNRWRDVMLFNPRRSFLASFSPNDFIEYISAGKRAAQVYQEIEGFLLHRDFAPEHRF